MMSAHRELERVESRVLAALRPVDATTGATLSTPISLRAEGEDVRIVRNRSGLYVVTWWARLSDHEAAFIAPPPTPPGTLRLPLIATDPLGRYLPRRVTVALPRDPDPEAAASLFEPVDLVMYPAAAGAIAPNWAVARVTVVAAGSADRLGGALLLVRREGAVLARGLTDGRGEALLVMGGIPMQTFGEEEDAVVATHVEVAVQALFDPEAGTRFPALSAASGERAPLPLVDPDAMEAADLPTATDTLSVAARQSRALTIPIALP